MLLRSIRLALPVAAISLVAGAAMAGAASSISHPAAVSKARATHHFARRPASSRVVVKGTVTRLGATSISIRSGSRRTVTMKIVAASVLNGVQSGDTVRAYGHRQRRGGDTTRRRGGGAIILDRVVIVTPGGGGPPPPPPTTLGVTITSKPAASTTSTSATIAWTGTGAITSTDCALDAGAFATCTSPSNLTGLSVGAHSYHVRVSDGTTTAMADANWTITSAPPPPPPPSAPVNTGLPVVTAPSPPRNGNVLTTTNGTWSNTPTGYAYQWLRCTTAVATSCSNISGATGSTYTLDTSPAGGDSQKFFRVTVTATNGAGSASATSAPTTQAS
jgi:hypothetical protein